MIASFKIAKRYFFAKKNHNFINFLSIISMLSVCVVTAVLIIVLSIFNGMDSLIRSTYRSFDAPLKISAIKGKTFIVNDSLISIIKNVNGVEYVSKILEDNALLRYKDHQAVVMVKAIDDNFLKINKFDSLIVQGKMLLQKDLINYAVIGRGVQYKLGISLAHDNFPMQLWYPKRNKKGVSLEINSSFNQSLILPSGVFAIERQYDENYIFTSFDFAKELFEYHNECSAIEISVLKTHDLSDVQNELIEKLGEKFKVQNSEQQHAPLLRAIKIEKLFALLAFSFIIGVASLSIYFCLTMLVIEKKKDMAILYAIGATSSQIKKIFIHITGIIAGVGASVGLFLGWIICFIQQQFGLISMGMGNSITEAYPVEMRINDFIFIGVVIISITMLVAWSPAKRASEIKINEFI